jgi:hypothetical protein
MNTDTLREFLIETKKVGYGAGNNKGWIKEKDGSTTIPFESGDFRMHDNFFGGEPWGGREVVFYEDKPVWIMVMYGSVDNKVKGFEGVYKFLQKSLRNQPEDLPLRGPKFFKEGDFVYKNKTIGDLENFIGKEEIYKGKKRIYQMNYSGGWVDQRKE